MTWAPAFTGTIHGGVLRPDQPSRWREHVNSLNGQRVRVTVVKASQARSLVANNYLRGPVYDAIADWCGHDPDELHEIFKAMFLPSREITVAGKRITVQGSTAGMDVAEFSRFVDRVKLWAAEQGVRVPEPNEVA